LGFQNEYKAENSFEEELKEPEKYKVILLNDDYTSMDFVVEVLVTIFHHPLEKAVNIMLKIHREGEGVCGVYTYEIAETKVEQVRRKARENEYPLRVRMEKA